jgi:hypothetical protein
MNAAIFIRFLYLIGYSYNRHIQNSSNDTKKITLILSALKDTKGFTFTTGTEILNLITQGIFRHRTEILSLLPSVCVQVRLRAWVHNPDHMVPCQEE